MKSVSALILSLVLAAGVAPPAGGAPPVFQTPSVIFDEGTTNSQRWQTGARRSGRHPCFWIRVRNGEVEVPQEWCGGPKSYPHFIAFAGRPGHRVGVELVIAPLIARTVVLAQAGGRSREVRLQRVGRAALAAGLKRNFRHSTQIYTKKVCIRSATYFDEKGELIHEFEREC